MSSLVVRSLSVRLSGQPILEGLDLEVEPGDIVGLLGPNGAGKTTAFRAITGLVPLAQGEILLSGVPLEGQLHRRVRMGLGYVPQESCCIGGLSLIQQVEVALEARGASRQEALSFLARVELEALAHRQVDSLSGGELRRLELARCLATNPKVLLLDEPFAGLSPKSISLVATMIRSLADSGLGVLLTDHAVRDALALCNSVTLLEKGRVLLSGSAESVARDPAARQRWLGEDWKG